MIFFCKHKATRVKQLNYVLEFTEKTSGFSIVKLEAIFSHTAIEQN
jgi:hypothetical protein